MGSSRISWEEVKVSDWWRDTLTSSSLYHILLKIIT